MQHDQGTVTLTTPALTFCGAFVVFVSIFALREPAVALEIWESWRSTKRGCSSSQQKELTSEAVDRDEHLLAQKVKDMTCPSQLKSEADANDEPLPLDEATIRSIVNPFAAACRRSVCDTIAVKIDQRGSSRSEQAETYEAVVDRKGQRHDDVSKSIGESRRGRQTLPLDEATICSIVKPLPAPHRRALCHTTAVPALSARTRRGTGSSSLHVMPWLGQIQVKSHTATVAWLPGSLAVLTAVLVRLPFTVDMQRRLEDAVPMFLEMAITCISTFVVFFFFSLVMFAMLEPDVMYFWCASRGDKGVRHGKDSSKAQEWVPRTHVSVTSPEMNPRARSSSMRVLEHKNKIITEHKSKLIKKSKSQSSELRDYSVRFTHSLRGAAPGPFHSLSAGGTRLSPIQQSPASSTYSRSSKPSPFMSEAAKTPRESRRGRQPLPLDEATIRSIVKPLPIRIQQLQPAPSKYSRSSKPSPFVSKASKSASVAARCVRHNSTDVRVGWQSPGSESPGPQVLVQ
jgi:hypothetical protein